MESIGGGLCVEVGLCSATFFLFREPAVVTLLASNSNSGTGAEVAELDQVFLASFWRTPKALVCTRRKKQAKKSTWTGLTLSRVAQLLPHYLAAPWGGRVFPSLFSEVKKRYEYVVLEPCMTMQQLFLACGVHTRLLTWFTEKVVSLEMYAESNGE